MFFLKFNASKNFYILRNAIYRYIFVTYCIV